MFQGISFSRERKLGQTLRNPKVAPQQNRKRFVQHFSSESHYSPRAQEHASQCVSAYNMQPSHTYVPRLNVLWQGGTNSLAHASLPILREINDSDLISATFYV